MNIFRLSDDPFEASVFHQDLHVKKMILESAQLLANCYTLDQLKLAPKTQKGNFRGYSHIHHPISKWVKEDFYNFNWTLTLLRALCGEYQIRFHKKHFTTDFMEWVVWNQPKNLPSKGPTEQPQCFKEYPQCIVPGNPVQGYRNYYNAAKLKFDFRGKIIDAAWTGREKPNFIK